MRMFLESLHDMAHSSTSMTSVVEYQFWVYMLYACTHTILSRDLYIFHSIFEDHFFIFLDFFKKILTLCMYKSSF